MGFILPVANVVNLIVENWMIALAALAVFASLCLGLFKGAKHGIRAMTILLLIAIAAVCSFVVYYFAVDDMDGLIKFCIAWLPTILFLIIIIESTLRGIRRGLRKSLIFALHAIIAAGICLGAFFFCVTSPVVDKGLLNFINLFLGTDGLQNRLGISAECETLRDVLMELFDSYTLKWGQLGILLGNNSAYILALVNMAYRLVFAFIFLIVYKLLLFLLYLIYLIFYPERRYKKKRNIRFALNQAESSYKKHPVGGGCVGAVRGLVSGLVSLSFIGTAFFVAVGGSGAARLPEDISFGDNYNPFISIYRSIESYGDQGIFKILNAISDPNDTPYYLFAADIVFSGGLDDEQHDVSGNIKFREELAAYTGFAKNTLALLLKYDSDGEIAAILRGEGGGNSRETMDKILHVFTKHEFRVEFENLIDNFDEKTYVINFSLSLADAVIANVDDMSFMQSVSADNKELLQILFSRNYLSNTIPDERDRKQAASSAMTEDGGEIPPYITINHLLTKRDAQIVLDIVLSIIANEINVNDVHSIATKLIPSIEELSIVSDRRSSEMDPVLGRLYCYFENRYLTDEGEDGITYAEIKKESAHWTKELRGLMTVADGLVTMYDKIQNRGETGIFKAITSLFDENSEDYGNNVRMYEELCDVVSDSTILSKALCSNKIHKLLNDQLVKISENVYLPRKISYANTYDSNGKLISHGEAYQLLRGLRLLAEKENVEIVESLTGDSSFEDLLNKLSETVTKDDPYAHGNSLASYLTESVIFRSVITSVIRDRAGDMMAVPTLSLETDGDKRVNIINKKELREILDALPELTDLLLTLKEEEIKAEDVNRMLNNESFNFLLDNGNKIVEGTIAKHLIEMLADNDTIIISAKLENFEEWITVNNPGELRKFLRTRELLELDTEALMEGEGLDGTKILDRIKELDDDGITKLFDSEVFYYSASNMLDRGEFSFDGFKVIVPDSSCNNLENDKIERVIKKNEMTLVFVNLKNFGLTAGMENESIIRKLIEQNGILDDSYIISASVVNYLVTTERIHTALNMPYEYTEAGSGERLRVYDASNPWHAELPKLIAAIDEIFGVSEMLEGEEFKFDSVTNTDKTRDLILHLNDKSKTNPRYNRIDVCHSSEIIWHNITAELDKVLVADLIEISVRDSIKTSSRSGFKVYSSTEISNLVEAFKVLGIESIDKLKEHNFSETIKNLNEPSGTGEPKLKTLYRSDIVAGVLTKTIKETFASSGLAYHTSAERSDVAVLKEQEIEALISLLGGDELGNLNVKNLSLAIIKDQLADEEGNTRSYLIAANFTKTVIENENLFVPSSVYNNQIITPAESVSFIDAINALMHGDNSLGSWDVSNSMVLPDGEARAKILESAIMRATFSQTIFSNNDSAAFAATDIIVVDRIGAAQAKIAVISAEQLEALFDIIAKLGNGELKIPPLEFGSIASLSEEDIDLYCAFDSTRYTLSLILSALGESDGNEEDWYLFTGADYERKKIKVLSAEEIKQIIENLSKIPNL